jgi:hypothetical protein
MAVNILLGIGGTGAKIVESALYLLSAGFGSDGDVHVGLVDQDNSNGNVVRTEDLLKLLVSIRNDFGEGRGNRIDWSNGAADAPGLFSIRLTPLMGEGAHWRPAEDDQPDLRAIMQHEQMPENEKALFDLLFRGGHADPADAEQTMGLAEGYRGRAHVGAAALVSAVNFDSPEFLERIIELMRRSSAGEEVRIFIAGSLFGGTGAAGFPTIARTLHRLRSGDDRRMMGAKIHIAGALMLPYFAFADPADEHANVVTSSQLLPQARVAVDYYQRLLRQERVFDRLYVCGWDSMFQLGYHEAGRGDQRNPPLPPELLAALGAADFFTIASDEIVEAEPLTAARRSATSFGWQDLPVRDDLRSKLYDQFGGALRFALWWRYRVEPAIDDRGIFGIRWLKRLAAGTDWQTGTPQARIRIDDYAGNLLRWASAMRLFSKSAVGEFSLWNGERLWARSDVSRPTDPIDLHAARSEEDSARDLEGLLVPHDRNVPPVGAAVVFKDLNEASPGEGHEGFGRLVAGVHRATRPFRTGE